MLLIDVHDFIEQVPEKCQVANRAIRHHLSNEDLKEMVGTSNDGVLRTDCAG